MQSKTAPRRCQVNPTRPGALPPAYHVLQAFYPSWHAFVRPSVANRGQYGCRAQHQVADRSRMSQYHDAVRYANDPREWLSHTAFFQVISPAISVTVADPSAGVAGMNLAAPRQLTIDVPGRLPVGQSARSQYSTAPRPLASPVPARAIASFPCPIFVQSAIGWEAFLLRLVPRSAIFGV
jgi:hypothetical protein